jgi:carbohydrate-binding DOMON domain-containing protein
MVNPIKRYGRVPNAVIATVISSTEAHSTYKHTDTLMNRQTDRQIDGQTETNTDRQRDRQTD